MSFRRSPRNAEARSCVPEKEKQEAERQVQGEEARPRGGGRAGVQMQACCWHVTLWPSLWLLCLSEPLWPRQTALHENESPLFKHVTLLFGLGWDWVTRELGR